MASRFVARSATRSGRCGCPACAPRASVRADILDGARALIGGAGLALALLAVNYALPLLRDWLGA
jgi:hypothetical protein